MPARSGKCSNFGMCGKADARESLAVSDGAPMECPECGRPLTAAAPSSSGGGGLGGKKLGIIGGALAAIVAAGVFLLPPDKPDLPPDVPPSGEAVTPPAGAGDPATVAPPPVDPSPGGVDPATVLPPVNPPRGDAPTPIGPIKPQRQSRAPGPEPDRSRDARPPRTSEESVRPPVTRPETAAVDAGVLRARLLSDLSTRTAREGDVLNLMIEDGPYAGGQLRAVVKKAKGPGRLVGRGKSEISFQFEELVLRGRAVAIDAELRSITNSRGKVNVDENNRVIGTSMSKKKRGLISAVGAGIGAGVGVITGGGAKGAVVGAGAGAAAGLVASYTIVAQGSEMDLNKGSVFTLALRDGR